MVVPTPSSNGRPPRPAGARASVLLGLLSIGSIPAAVAATRWFERYELLHAAAAIPVGALFGALAIALAGRARGRLAPTLGHPTGTRTARTGRLLGIAGVLLALTAAGSVGVYAVLSLVAD